MCTAGHFSENGRRFSLFDHKCNSGRGLGCRPYQLNGAFPRDCTQLIERDKVVAQTIFTQRQLTDRVRVQRNVHVIIRQADACIFRQVALIQFCTECGHLQGQNPREFVAAQVKRFEFTQPGIFIGDISLQVVFGEVEYLEAGQKG